MFRSNPEPVLANQPVIRTCCFKLKTFLVAQSAGVFLIVTKVETTRRERRQRDQLPGVGRGLDCAQQVLQNESLLQRRHKAVATHLVTKRIIVAAGSWTKYQQSKRFSRDNWLSCMEPTTTSKRTQFVRYE
eukprot:COSAG06_NODE_2875_length_6146_cov_8.191335_2_plen_131_part_00